MTLDRELDQLTVEVVLNLKAIRLLPEGRRADRAELMTELARNMIKLRMHYLTEDGKPDLRGDTWAYRDALREMYTAAGYTGSDRAKVQNTVRYHIGNLMDEVVDEETLEEVGIGSITPKDRQKARRRATSALLANVAASTDPDAPLADKVRTYTDILTTLNAERLNNTQLAKRDNADDAQRMADLLTAIRDRCDVLLSRMRVHGFTGYHD